MKKFAVLLVLMALLAFCGCAVGQTAEEFGEVQLWYFDTEDTVVDPYAYLEETPESTCFSYIGYDADYGHLFVVFRESGVMYVYYGVDMEEWMEFTGARSLGSYFNSHIKGSYYYSAYVETNE